MLELEIGEIEYITKSPDVLRALADYHHVQETLADGMGMTVSAGYHQAKAERYLEMARQRVEAIERGDD